MFLTIKGIQTNIQTINQGKNKIIFLHGWGGSTKSFEHIAPIIAKKNKAEAILIDLPGFGKSATPPKTGWDTYQYAKWLESTLKELKIKEAIFYAHSFGCRVTIRLLTKHPKYAKKIILTGAAGIKWPPTKREKISLYLSKKFQLAKHIIPQTIQKIIITKIFGARDWGAVPANLKPTLKKVLAEEDLRKELKKITIPTLLIWGKQDKITPLKSGKIYHQNLKNSKLKILQNTTHGVHKQQPKKVIKLVNEFLKTTP